MAGSARVLISLLQTAVVKEGLRMFPGGATLPRVVPPEGATIAETFIPGGVSPWLCGPADSGACLLDRRLSSAKVICM